MSKCFRCGESYPSAKVLEIHKNHCDGKVAAPAVRTNPTPRSIPVRPTPTPKPFAMSQRTQASKKTPSRSVTLEPIQPIAVSINESVYLGSFVTMMMGSVMWACVMALTSFVDAAFSPMFVLAAIPMSMSILSLGSQRSPNELAAAMIQGGREVRSGQLLMGGLSLALGAGMFVTNGWIAGAVV